MSEEAARIVRNDEASQYEAYLDGTLAGVAVFVSGNGRTELIHTEVTPEFRGRGIGEQLAHTALRVAQDAGDLVVPTCPFVARYLREHPEFAELRAS